MSRVAGVAMLAAAVWLAGCAAREAAPGATEVSAPLPVAEQAAPAPDMAALLALEDVRLPADPRYLELLAQAKGDGAGITRERMIALRWAWMGSTDFNPIMPTRLNQAARPREGEDCGRARRAATAVLAIHWLDLRGHAVVAAMQRWRNVPSGTATRRRRRCMARCVTRSSRRCAQPAMARRRTGR